MAAKQKHGKGWKKDASGDWRNYAKETAYEMRPEQVKNRRARDAARAAHGLKVGDPREVDHIVPLNKGGSKEKSNTRVTSRSFNRKRSGKAR